MSLAALTARTHGLTEMVESLESSCATLGCRGAVGGRTGERSEELRRPPPDRTVSALLRRRLGKDVSESVNPKAQLLLPPVPVERDRDGSSYAS